MASPTLTSSVHKPTSVDTSVRWNTEQGRYSQRPFFVFVRPKVVFISNYFVINSDKYCFFMQYYVNTGFCEKKTATTQKFMTKSS